MSLPTPDLAADARVLCVRLDNVGDVVMLGPTLRGLRAAHPGWHLTLLASPAGASVAPLLPWLDAVEVERALWQDASGQLPFDPEREWALIERLRAARYDAALVFTSWAQSPFPAAYAAYLAGVPVRIGESKEFGGAVLSHAVETLPDAVHQVDRNAHLVVSTGLAAVEPHLELALPASAEAGAAALLAGVERPYVVAAPGASCSARRYPPARFAAAVAGLAPVVDVVVVGSERERDLLAPVRAVPGVHDLVGRTDLESLTAVIAGAAVVVANDSGPMHLADAFARPQVVLYSGTELESQWAPRTSPATILRRDTPCTPCHLFECPIGLPCLDVDPSEVVAAVHAHLAPTARRGPTEGDAACGACAS
jgi:ADP-heptose:LPS heptosyltransferase